MHIFITSPNNVSPLHEKDRHKPYISMILFKVYQIYATKYFVRFRFYEFDISKNNGVKFPQYNNNISGRSLGKISTECYIPRRDDPSKDFTSNFKVTYNSDKTLTQSHLKLFQDLKFVVIENNIMIPLRNTKRFL